MYLRPFRALYPDLEKIESIETFLESVKEDYQAFAKAGVFLEMDIEALYVYRITRGINQYTGLIAGVDIEDLVTGKIKAHEKTIREKEEMQVQLLSDRKASVKPILLFYRSDAIIRDCMTQCVSTARPDFDLVIDGGKIRHQFWSIIDPEQVVLLQQLFKDRVESTYIADGHHRISAALRLFESYGDRAVSDPLSNPFRNIFCALFASDELEVLDFKRILDVARFPECQDLLAEMGKLCDVLAMKAPGLPNDRHELTLYYRGKWHRLRWKPEILERIDARFDTTLLSKVLFRDTLHVTDINNDDRLHYIGADLTTKQLEEYTDQMEDGAAFCLHPLEVNEVLEVTDAGLTLPPKSTWFEPRLKNGAIVMGYN